MTDLVILNGRVMTFAGPDAEALAITGGVITAVGSNAEIRDLAGSARVIDAQGNTVLPGFIDSHVHLFQGAAELEYLNLHGVTGFDAIAAKVRLYSASRQDDVLLFANCFEYHAFGDAPTTRQDLDAVVSDRPFFVMASDGHTGWANTKALELRGFCMGWLLMKVRKLSWPLTALRRESCARRQRLGLSTPIPHLAAAKPQAA